MNTLFIIDNQTERQIDPISASITQGVVTSVTDALGDTYEGSQISVLTPRDYITVTDLHQPLCVGDEIYLNNQSRQRWTVRHGWYEVDGNPAICGWYLESIPVGRVRSLYLKDLDSLTMATSKTAYTIPDTVKGD